MLFLGFIGSGTSTVHAQDKEEKDLGTQTVTVVKAYTPTIADAFKIKMMPTLNDSLLLKKRQIQYTIFSVPVASTFTPAKGTAAALVKSPPEKLYNSSATIGVGSYANAIANFYTSRALNRDERLDFGVQHLSSSGTVDKALLTSTFYDTNVMANYIKTEREMQWGVHGGVSHKIYHWYGVSESELTLDELNGVDAKQRYFSAELGADIHFEDAIFNDASFLLRHFSDRVSSAENQVVFEPKITFPVADEQVQLTAKLEYLSGSFENAPLSNFNTAAMSYSGLQITARPQVVLMDDTWKVQLGVAVTYASDMENSTNKLYFYPAVDASYAVWKDMLIAFGSVNGALKQNTYADFVSDNPFVSPTLTVRPTDVKYVGELGVKGKLGTGFTYSFSGSYKNAANQALYVQNPINRFRPEEKSYVYGNSFNVTYQDIKTLGIHAKTGIAVSDSFTLGAAIDFYTYTMDEGATPFNLPDAQAELSLDYVINEKWFAGASLFYMGQRQDQEYTLVQTIANAEIVPDAVLLPTYLDANAHVGYRLNEQWLVFLKLNNITNNAYDRWSGFPVQGFQVMAGATYKFDF